MSQTLNVSPFTLIDRVGQRLMVTFPGYELTGPIADFLLECRAGGVILFGRNITNLPQVRRLNDDLQQLARENNLPPLMIGIDEEGGRVSRMPGDGKAVITPSQMAQAVAGREAVATCAGVTARQLRRLGFNLNFAPVLDINNNPANPVIGSRSFGMTPELVGEMGVAAIGAYLAEGIAPCAKHFPGHGDTLVDSHLGLPELDFPLTQLWERELKPFVQAIAAGLPALMTAHILFPAIEPNNLPATLSRLFMTTLLRDELGFEGVLFTDALIMRAIADTYGYGVAAVLALQAGADVVMPLGKIEEQRICFATMLEAAERGEFELTASDNRLARFKARFCQLMRSPLELYPPQADVELIAQVARRSVSLIQDETHLLPLAPAQYVRPALLDFTLAIASPVEEGRLPGPLLAGLLQQKLPGLTVYNLPADPDETQAAEYFELAAAHDLLIIVTRNAFRLERQGRLVRELLQLNKATVILAARDPYDLGAFPNAPTYLALYGDPPCSLEAAVGLLFG